MPSVYWLSKILTHLTNNDLKKEKIQTECIMTSAFINNDGK